MNKKEITQENKNIAEEQIKEKQKQIDYDTKDYTIEHIVRKFNEEELFIPPYQRNFVWSDKYRTAFIESILLGLPIPFMFFGNCENGNYEIIDGAQRVQTLVAFVDNNFSLYELAKLESLNGFSFSDLSEPQKKKFLNKSMRVIILEEDTSDDIRQDLFHRINTCGVKANESEIRRGSYVGKLTNFINECSKNTKFIKLAPMSATKEDRYERFELVLRFFAYLNEYENFKQKASPFLDDYLKNNLESFDEDRFKKEFEDMLNFVEETFDGGFVKPKNPNTTPRVRFEALAVGSALALREKPNLKVLNTDWISSVEFEKHVTSGASNSQGKLQKRIEYVRDKLLKVDKE